jgi:hypothetical protein
VAISRNMIVALFPVVRSVQESCEVVQSANISDVSVCAG